MAKNGFDIKRNQKLGLFGLSALLLVLIVLLNVEFSKDFDDPFALNEEEFSYFSTQLKPERTDFVAEQKTSKQHREVELFEFDPNELSREGFSSLGFSEKQSESIVSYRERFGFFQSKEDFKKLYVVSDEKFEQLEPYMIIEKKVTAPTLSINNASNEDLMGLKGIGPVYAERIIKYRDLLGGFVSSEQFSEVYGLSDETVTLLARETVVDIALTNGININEASKKELRKHPYLDFETVALILEERDKAPLVDLNFLTGKIDSVKIERIIPYINFE